MGAEYHYDWIVIGSGFGGSVSALRLAEKGYRVLVLEKGRRVEPEDMPKTNWDLPRWYWMPSMGLKGIYQMTFFDHATILHGVGVGGGSLNYANTLPVPKDDFFKARSWSHLSEDWRTELWPHYEEAMRMLGRTRNPRRTRGDEVLGQIAREIGREDDFHLTDVAVFFGEPDEQVADPYFGGKGPDRLGCNFCGGCMTGCRTGAKNTLDRNYLYLAQRLGARILPETEVTAVRPRAAGGYRIEAQSSTSTVPRQKAFTADRIVFAGGVLGTVPLLLKMQEESQGLPQLSRRLGDSVRTNSEALIAIVTPRTDIDFSKGVAITSILHTDEHSHIEPVRHADGSGFFRSLLLPHSPGRGIPSRLSSMASMVAKHPTKVARALTVDNWARQSQVLLYMRTLDSTLSLRLGRSALTGFRRALVSKLDDPAKAPQAFMQEATDLAWRFADKIDGVPFGLVSEVVLGSPSTAHILGGCCMGQDPDDGVIDKEHRVFGHEGLYVIDGSSVSANPGVNPALTITALAERAMSKIPMKN